MMFSIRSSGEVACDVRGCRWRQSVEVEGRDGTLRAEQARRLEAHRRQDHPWLYVGFSSVDASAVLQRCTVCGVAVVDEKQHQEWHRRSGA